MSVRFPYDEAINPPAPTVPVRVSSIQGEWSSAVPSILDTGADITVIPARLAGDLRLRPVDEIQIRGATGASARAPIYRAALEVAGREVTAAVVGIGRELIVGRDLMNRWTIVLRGPERVFEIETS